MTTPAFILGDAGAKGRGLFATRDIGQAEVILIEHPILSIENDMNDNLKQEKLFKEFLKLPEDKREEILKLHDVCGEYSSPEEKLLNIFLTNSVATFLPGERATAMSSLHMKTSYINHSCNPNCCWAPEDKPYITVLSLVPIKAGEELTVSYVPVSWFDRGNCPKRRERLFTIKFTERLFLIAPAKFVLWRFNKHSSALDAPALGLP